MLDLANRDLESSLAVGQCATLACVLEVTAPKPGNVHRGADFFDASYIDFIAGAVAIGPHVQAAAEGTKVGAAVLAAVEATRRVTSTNTNLGTVLLLVPLAKAASASRDLAATPEALAQVLESLQADDARLVYEAIRLARPGGLGQVESGDMHQAPPGSLLDAMRLAADRDLVARQYVTNFETVLTAALPWLVQARQAGHSLADAIVQVQLRLMAAWPDSLIARKCGADMAQQASDRAADVLELGQPGDQLYLDGLADLDFWLRSDGHRRNPGTTADLIAAGLFVGLLSGQIRPPFNMQTSLP
ncbi:MAG: triphosphoribosyl-dephospho-CoA synthase [Pirellulales bacterium]